MKILFFMDHSHCMQCVGLEQRLNGWNRLPIIKIDYTDDESIDVFSKYNIRNLPTLVLVDEEGKEINRWGNIAGKNVLDDYLNNLKNGEEQ